MASARTAIVMGTRVKFMEAVDAWRMTERLTHEFGRGDPFAAAIRATRMPMIITDPRQSDNPIVFANDAFLTLTGYARDEVMGRNCRFLQGSETDRQAVDQLRNAVRLREDVNIDILNYRKDGTPFWNALYMSPVSSAAGELQYFFASQFDVTERRDALQLKTALLHEVDHRVKNNLQMVTALIAMQAATIADAEVRRSLETMMQRIEALSTVHRRLYQSDDVTRFSVADFVHDIVADLVSASGRGDIKVRLDLQEATVLADKAAPLALMVNEVVTNALKHAFVEGRPGNITAAVTAIGDRLRIDIADDGTGMLLQSDGGTSFGKSLIEMLARQLRATVIWSPVEPSGTLVTFEMPT